MKRLPLHLAALLAAALTAACGGGRSSGPNGTNVVLIVVDTLRRDHVSCYGYERETTPHVDRLAADGVRYETAYAQAPWTTPSLASLLTSRLPDELGVRSTQSVVPDEAVLLGEMLEPYDYVTGAIVSHKLCSSRWNFDQGFATFDESTAHGHKTVSSPEVTELATRFVEERARDGRPFFLMVHLFDPHLAWMPHGSLAFEPETPYTGPVRAKRELAEYKKLELDEDDRAELVRLYDSEVRFTDHHVGLLLERLRELELYDDALIVLTSDHGEELLDHGRLGHGRTLFAEAIEVPLIVKYPRGREPLGGRTQPAALLDVVPTVLDVAGIPPAVPLRGHPLGGAPRDRAIPSYTHMGDALRSVCDVRFKLVQVTATGEESLYNLARDPGEHSDMLARGPIGLAGAVRERLVAELEAWDALHEPIPARRRRLGADERESLRELGYTAGE